MMVVLVMVSPTSNSTPTIISSCTNTRRRRSRIITSSSSSSSSDSKRTTRRGFGTPQKEKSPSLQLQNKNKNKNNRNRNSDSRLSQPTQAPGLNSSKDGSYKNSSVDLEFEERLKAVSRSAVEQKKADKMKEFGAIDYDAPNETTDDDNKTVGLGTKIGVGVAVVVFGLVFALGDFLPSGSDIPPEDAIVLQKKLSDEEKSILETRLKQFETALGSSPKDPTALEGAAVTLAELGEYKKAASGLEELVKEKPDDPDVFRLLGEVKFELKDYDGSAAAYRSSAKVSKGINFEVLRGLTNSLLAAKKPDEAVQVLLTSRNQLKSKKSDINPESSSTETDLEVDPIQIDLLLGKAYSDWGHISDAASIYDGIISSNPDDFRGYLAKGILLKENGNAGDAERMFIQARFFAPEKAKALVDRYSRR